MAAQPATAWRSPARALFAPDEDVGVLRALLVFRLLVTLPFVMSYLLTESGARGYPVLAAAAISVTVLQLAELAVVAAGGSGTARLARAVQLIMADAAVTPALVAISFAADGRGSAQVGAFHPLDGHAACTLVLVAYLWGRRATVAATALVVVAEIAGPLAQFGFSLTTLALVCQGSYWVVLTAALGIFVMTVVPRQAEAARLSSATEERLRQHHLLHNRAVQTLTAVALDRRSTSWDDIRREAADEAARLRAVAAGRSGARPELEAAIQAMVLRHAGTLQVDYRVIGVPTLIPAAVVGQLATAVDEALTNVAKHAGPVDTVVTVRGGRGKAVICVDDDGPGIGAPTRGYGLSNAIRGAVEMAGGIAAVERVPAGAGNLRGTRVRLVWPGPQAVAHRPRGAPALRLPAPVVGRVLLAAALWQGVGSLALLPVAAELQVLRRPLLASAAVGLLAVAGTLPSAAVGWWSRQPRRRYPLAALAIAVFAVLAQVAQLPFVPPRSLLRPYADLATVYATGAAAAVVFLGGPWLGVAAATMAAAGAVVVAPLLNGYDVPALLDAQVIHRLLLIASGGVVAGLAGNWIARAYARERNAAAAVARSDEARQIGATLGDFLEGVAGAEANTPALRSTALSALTWARHRIRDAGGAATALAVGLADVVGRHVEVFGPGYPEVDPLPREVPGPVVVACQRLLDGVLGASSPGEGPMTVTARADGDRLHLDIVRRDGDAPPGPAVQRAGRLVAGVGGQVRAADLPTGFLVSAVIPLPAEAG